MGPVLSHLNNRLSFDFAEYVRERDELSSLLRAIAKSSELHRTRKEKMQLVSAGSSAAAVVAGTVAVIAAPATFGLSLPVVATTVGIVGNSITAASITSSAASFGHGMMVGKDIVKQLENLQCIIDSIAKKDEEVTALIESLEKDKIHEVKEAGDKFNKKISFADDDKAKNSSLAAWSILSPGTYAILQGRAHFKSEQEFEEALVNTADKIDDKTAVLRQLEDSKFKYMGCLPTQRQLSRGRLTYVDGGGGCSRIMKVHYRDPHEGSFCAMESDSTNVIRLPEGATDIMVTFFVKGGRTVKKIDRFHPKQPWTKSVDGEHEVDMFELDRGDGVDAVFYLKGSFTHSYVHKAWDFGRDPSTSHRSWEWWPDDMIEKERTELLPDSEKRALERTVHTHDEPWLTCGACCGRDGSVVEPVGYTRCP